jgi:hypothetical protein
MTETICSNCNTDLQKEKEFFENPVLPEEKYCMRCAIKKAGITPMDLVELLTEK